MVRSSEHRAVNNRYGRTEHLDAESVRRGIGRTATTDQYRSDDSSRRGPLVGDVFVPGGLYLLGGVPTQPWVFDAERYAHPVMVEPFEISKAPVTNAE